MAEPIFITGNGAPGYRRLLRWQLLALLPVTAAAVLNSGYQYLMRRDGGADAAAGLRENLAARLVGAHADPGALDYIAAGLAHLLPMLLLALLVGGFWERIIGERRRRPLESGFVPTALLFTLLLPGATPFAHIVFGMSCAILLGKGIFGGDGLGFVNPALLGFALLQVSFPGLSDAQPLWQGLAGYGGSEALALYARGGEAALAAAGIDAWGAFVGATPGTLGTTSVLAVALGAALLLWQRIIAWRLLAAQLLGLIGMATLFNLAGADGGAAAMPAYWHLLLGSFAFGAVFLACDPTASCCTNPGRWVQGLLIGALVVLIRVANTTHPDAVIPALLLASITAPLIDHAVIAWNVRNRARRHV